jgi:AcrR family transcriptional regulator
MDKQETKNKVFMAAADLFATKGYYDVSVREICEAAGVTKPVLYYYFKDKEDLLESLVTEVHERSARLFEEQLKPEASFEESLDGLLKIYIIFANDYPYLIRLSAMVEFSPLPQRIKTFSREKSDEQWKFILKTFDKAKKEGACGKEVNNEMLALSLLAPVGIIVARNVLLKDNRISLNKVLRKYFEFWKDQFYKIPDAE